MTGPVVAASVGQQAATQAAAHPGATLALAILLIWLAGVAFFIAFTGGFGNNPGQLLDTLASKLKAGSANARAGGGGS